MRKPDVIGEAGLAWQEPDCAYVQGNGPHPFWNWWKIALDEDGSVRVTELAEEPMINGGCSTIHESLIFASKAICHSVVPPAASGDQWDYLTSRACTRAPSLMSEPSEARAP